MSALALRVKIEQHMNLSEIAVFLFWVTFLVGFAMTHHGDWMGYAAYAVIVVLVLVTIVRFAI